MTLKEAKETVEWFHANHYRAAITKQGDEYAVVYSKEPARAGKGTAHKDGRSRRDKRLNPVRCSWALKWRESRRRLSNPALRTRSDWMYPADMTLERQMVYFRRSLSKGQHS